jgi:competence protein ComEA
VIRRTLLLLILCVQALWTLPAWALVDVNTAAESELETLPGIGPSKARAILEYRTQHGAFQTVDQLDDVPGIGPATLANIRAMVTVTATAAGPSTTPQAVVATPADTSSTTAHAPITAATGNTRLVNINTADGSALETLPGIGPAKASAILEYRTQNGPFTTCEGLLGVPGIGPATMAGLKDYCTTQ